MDRVLGVFAKAPRPGEVKSRLARDIGAAMAAKLYDAFLRDLLPRLATIDAKRIVAFASPADRNFFLELCGNRFELQLQMGMNLGSRMCAFFDGLFRNRANPAVLVGSDSPDLPLDRIERAFSALVEHDVVLGPSEDGGYYLIGMRRHFPELFDGVDWSTSRVFQQTKERLHSIGIGYAVLESWYDVDIAEDLRRLAEGITKHRGAGTDLHLPHTAAVLDEL